jgi:hypothetical protein
MACLGLWSVSFASGRAFIVGQRMQASALGALVWFLIGTVVVRWSVRHMRCRDPLVAAGLVLVAGVLGYLGSYHIDQCVRWQQPWSALGQLPGYITFRMQTDTWWWPIPLGGYLIPKPFAPGEEPLRWVGEWRWSALNELHFTYELLLLSVGLAGVAGLAARQPFDEERQRWCELLRLPMHFTTLCQLRQALANNAVCAWVDQRPSIVPIGKAFDTITVAFTEGQPDEPPSPHVLVSIDWVITGGIYWRLTAEEAAAFAVLLPGVRTVYEPAEQAGGVAATPQQPASPHELASDVAQIVPLPVVERGTINLPENQRRGFAVAVVGLALPAVLAVVLLPGGMWLAVQGVKAGWLPKGFPTNYMYSIAAVLLGMVYFAYLTPFPLWARLRFWFEVRQIGQMVAGRVAPWVRVDQSGAVAVEMLPRKYWHAQRLNAGQAGSGLLYCDPLQGCVWFEGDYQRYHLPVAAIVSAELERMTTMPDSAQAIFFVVLQVRTSAGLVELPLAPLGLIHGQTPRERAEHLRGMILALHPPELTDRCHPPFSAYTNGEPPPDLR